RSAGRTDDLSTTPGIQLEVVDHRARRDVPERQRISRKNVGIITGGNRRSNFQPNRLKDVTLVAIGIVQEREVRTAIRVVLDRGNLRRHAWFVAAKIDFAVLLFVAAAAVPYRNFALVVTAAGALFRFEERLFRRLLGDFALVENGHEPP